MLREAMLNFFYKNKTKTIDTTSVLWASLAVNKIMVRKLCSIFFIKTKQKLIPVGLLWASLGVN